MEDVKTRKVFQRGTHSDCNAQCVQTTNPSLFKKRVNESELYPKQLARLHCLRYGKYFTMKAKCLRCSYLLSFTQEAT